jgi:hypothetical protein
MDSIDIDLSDILTDTCDIVQDAATKDDYGHSTSPASDPYAAAQACRVLPDTRRGTEWKNDKQGGFSKYLMYIMPIPNNPITNQMWLNIVNNPDPNNVNGRYNIVEVVNPVIVGAPIELRLERIKP